MQEIKFNIAAGRARFVVIFSIGAGFLNAECTCPAGAYGNFCQHRLKLLRGDSSEVVSDNAEEIEKVIAHLPNTRLAIALQEFDTTADRVTKLRAAGPSTELDEAESEFKEVRKRLSIAMTM